MSLLLTIIISACIFSISKNHSIRLLSLIFSSLIIYWHFVGIGSIIVLLLVFITLLFKQLLSFKIYETVYIIALYIVMIVILYLGGKYIECKSIILPIGYSIVMFSGISLIVDETKSLKKYSLLESLAYLLFFPKILAGPIERFDLFKSQLQNSDKRDYIADVYCGVKIILFGSFLKYIVADYITLYTNAEYNGLNQLMSIFLYAIQFYCDFWAYSLLAIGFAKLYGINLIQNFNCPYQATSFKEFWKRWNISLSTWLRDYIYMPLQSSGNSIRCVNLFIVFIISALWHGISLPFLIWGISHAIFSSFEKNKLMSKLVGTKIYSSFVIVICSLLWQTFKFQDANSLCHQFKQVFIEEPLRVELLSILVISIIVVRFLESRYIQYCILKYENFSILEIISEVIILSAILLFFFFIGVDVNSPFFYFKY